MRVLLWTFILRRNFTSLYPAPSLGQKTFLADTFHIEDLFLIYTCPEFLASWTFIWFSPLGSPWACPWSALFHTLMKQKLRDTAVSRCSQGSNSLQLLLIIPGSCFCFALGSISRFLTFFPTQQCILKILRTPYQSFKILPLGKYFRISGLPYCWT